MNIIDLSFYTALDGEFKLRLCCMSTGWLPAAALLRAFSSLVWQQHKAAAVGWRLPAVLDESLSDSV